MTPQARFKTAEALRENAQPAHEMAQLPYLVFEACPAVFQPRPGATPCEAGVVGAGNGFRRPTPGITRSTRRALEQIGAVRVGRAATIGRPWLWRLRDVRPGDWMTH
jgi:hypothetical protein